ncbi:MAG: TRAP transporter large permease [Rhodospirillales bacterium]|jgi:tripartite ATP-independent transporter DctM subunit|nr:TRAP transporter large permease [Rhodospirillales bacterium]
MEWYWILSVLLGSILFLMFVGVPIGIAFILVNSIAAFFLYGRFGTFDANVSASIEQLTDNTFSNLAIFAIVPIPMFLLMGELFFHSGLAKRMFDAIENLMGSTPARLSYVTVAGGTAFATLSGSSMGSTALLGTLMVPEMQQRGYDKSMSIGPILGTGGLAMLIPPSALAVLLGTLAELDIGKLLIAGVIPGLILAVMYAGLIYIRVTINPSLAPTYPVEKISWALKLKYLLVDVVPMVSVIFLVILLIMFGVATPSESAAYGSVGVIILSFIYLFFIPLIKGDYEKVKIFWPNFCHAMWKSMWGASRVTIIALMILFGSSLFSNVLAGSGASVKLIEWVTSFDITGLGMLLVMFVILLFLGMFMDQLAMMLLTVPIFFPIMAGFDLGMGPEQQVIWFAVIMLLAMEISFTTPPFGLLLFVMQGVAPTGTRFSEICLAAIPFMACAMIVVALIITFPKIATWLPFIAQ